MWAGRWAAFPAASPWLPQGASHPQSKEGFQQGILQGIRQAIDVTNKQTKGNVSDFKALQH